MGAVGVSDDPGVEAACVVEAQGFQVVSGEHGVDQRFVGDTGGVLDLGAFRPDGFPDDGRPLSGVGGDEVGDDAGQERGGIAAHHGHVGEGDPPRVVAESRADEVEVVRGNDHQDRGAAGQGASDERHGAGHVVRCGVVHQRDVVERVAVRCGAGGTAHARCFLTVERPLASVAGAVPDRSRALVKRNTSTVGGEAPTVSGPAGPLVRPRRRVRDGGVGGRFGHVHGRRPSGTGSPRRGRPTLRPSCSAWTSRRCSGRCRPGRSRTGGTHRRGSRPPTTRRPLPVCP